ncbi:ABC transporter permease [Cellulomonas sp. 73-92]|uniref:ABC transporter permease n=1 Tax=Cellulomonas sp. 73-92 TaxID=1895740 RepID=UPI000AD9AC63|nr:ABC transporter permease [Cellulomonas sp. 73-92]
MSSSAIQPAVAAAGQHDEVEQFLHDPERIAAVGRQKLRRRIWSVVPVATFIGIVLVWAGAVWAFKIPQYLLPDPWSVFADIFNNWPRLWHHSQTTLAEIGAGYGISILIAIPLGLAISQSRAAKQIVYPPIMVLQLLPKVAVAPLFIVWLGLGFTSKLLLTILMTFFPLLIASISGFGILDKRLLYLTKSMGASTWQTFRHLRFPAALPIIFSGLQTSATLAVTGAIVAEFVGSNSGLGYVMLQATTTLDMPESFAVLVLMTIVGVAINYLVEFVQYVMTPWQRAKAN